MAQQGVPDLSLEQQYGRLRLLSPDDVVGEYGDVPVPARYAGDLEGVLIRNVHIRCRINELAAGIASDYEESPPLFVYLCEGARRFGADLAQAMRRYGIPCDPLPLTVKSYEGTESSGIVRVDEEQLDLIRSRVLSESAIRSILVLEDIVDTGLTMHKTVGLLTALREDPPISAAICTLLDKPERRAKGCEDLPVNYTGFIIPNLFVVGYGMDFDERYRDMDHIAVLAKKMYI